MKKIVPILIVACYFVFLIPLKGQQNNIKFENISIEQGLSQNTVYSILQDHKGFLWFGTEAGLNRYDGYNFNVYVDDKTDSTSISNYFIFCIYEDPDNNLWVGTEDGLNKYIYDQDKFVRYYAGEGKLSDSRINCLTSDVNGNLWIGTKDGLNKYIPSEDRFVVYRHDHNLPNSLSNNVIKSLFVDNQNVLWIGTESGGLNRLDLYKDNSSQSVANFTSYRNQEGKVNSLSNNTVNAIITDGDGLILVGTDMGLNKLDRAKLHFTRFMHDANDENSLCNDKIYGINLLDNGEIWVGTDGGLSRILHGSKRFVNYEYDPKDQTGLCADRILTIVEDKSDIIWLGSYGGGISKYDSKRNKFNSYTYDPNNTNSLGFSLVRPILEGPNGYLWVGTDGGGIDRIDRKMNIFTHFQHDPENPNGLNSSSVFSFHIDKQNRQWIGTYGGGLNIYLPDKDEYLHFISDSTDENSLSNDNVRVIIEAKNNVFWLATTRGLNRFIPADDITEKPQIKRYLHDPVNPNSLCYDRIYDMIMDEDGILWIATMGGGLSRFDPAKEEFTSFRTNQKDPNSISKDFVLCLHNDKNGILWIGTHGGGINRMDKKAGTFKHYTTNEGLPDNSIYAILQDDKGNLWFSSNKGIARFNPDKGEVKQYDISDGLQSNEFNGGSCYKSPSGELFFGGVKGLNYFFPDSIVDNQHIPTIVITDFKIYNKDVNVNQETNGNIILGRIIEETREIELTHLDNVISFEFAALDFADPERNNYAFMMENFDSDWNYIGNRRYATYTNLPPGEYVFRVKGSNCDGVWNEEGVSLVIRVLPPWWKTIGFYVGVGALLILLIVLYIKSRERKLIKDKKLLEYEVLNRTIEIEKQKEELEAVASHLAEVNQKLEKLSIVASKTANAITIFDNKGNIEFRNRAFWKLYGETLEEMVLKIGANLSDLDPFHVVHNHFRRCIETKSPISFTSCRQLETGEKYWVQSTLTPVIDAEQEVTNVVVIDTDITETKRAEETIKEQAAELEKLSIVASKTDNAVIIASASGEIEYINDGFTRLTGYSIAEFKEKCNNNLFNAMTNNNVRDDLRENARLKQTTIYYTQITTRSGAKSWVQTTITPSFDDNGELSKLIVIESDINKLKEAEEEIKLKNSQITDSIQYAQRIQHSILPSNKLFMRLFPDSFVMYRPRDIVSGDFYWMSEQDDKLFIAVCDCTGHGVPGGFMSMMGNALLNQIVNEKKIHKPSEILSQMNMGVVYSLNQTGESEQADGMDVSICCINRKNKSIIVAGANQIIYVMNKDGMKDIEGDIFSVGGMLKMVENVEFKDHTVPLNGGQTLYMFTDGYQDQFGGEDNRKYMSGKFRELLVKHSHLSMPEQVDALNATFDGWKGDYRQIDDVLVIGIRVEGEF